MTTNESTANVLNALPHPQATGAWSTPRDIADAVGAGYSTVTQALRALATDGLARSMKDGRATVWQATEQGVEAREQAARDADAGPRTDAVEQAPTVAEHVAAGTIDRVDLDEATVAPGAGGVIHVDEDVRPVDVPLDELLNDADAILAAVQAPPSDRVAAVDVVAPGEPATVTLTPATGHLAAVPPPAPAPATQAPSGGGVADVLAFMEAVRPVSAPPAGGDTAPARPRRVRTRPPRPNVKRSNNGGLKADIITWFREQSAGRVVSAADVSNALGAYSSSTGYALRVLADAGDIERVQENPPRYRAIVTTAAAS